jgi:hypothetical protein
VKIVDVEPGPSSPSRQGASYYVAPSQVAAEPVTPGLAIACIRGTMLERVPSLSALESNDDDRLAAELRLDRLRSQAAIIRTLADHVEHLARPADADGLGEQLIEEMADSDADFSKRQHR